MPQTPRENIVGQSRMTNFVGDQPKAYPLRSPEDSKGQSLEGLVLVSISHSLLDKTGLVNLVQTRQRDPSALG